MPVVLVHVEKDGLLQSAPSLGAAVSSGSDARQWDSKYKENRPEVMRRKMMVADTLSIQVLFF